MGPRVFIRQGTVAFIYHIPSGNRASLCLRLFSCLMLCGCTVAPSRPGIGGAPAAPAPARSTASALAQDADFIDISQKAGLNFAWNHQTKEPWTILESMGCGCAFLDYDNDGWMDIFLVGEPHCGLFHNNHDGTFTDVTLKAGINREGDWRGVCIGDYDNDGHEDIYVSGRGCSMLLHNKGDGTFDDVTTRAGLDEKEWGTSCGFFDADGDGKLDLLVGHYVKTGPPYPWHCTYDGVPTACRPAAYPAQFSRLYHNNGQGTFTDVTTKAGLGSSHGKTLGLQFCDYDNDGKVDFYLANDGVPGDLFHNIGGGRFKNVGAQTGTAFQETGQAQAGMGVDFGDYDRDGKMDLIVSNFQAETFSLYHNVGALFDITSTAAGLGPTSQYLGFGAKFVDFNDDGWPDLVFTTGHVANNAGQAYPGVSFKQRMLLFRNEFGHFSQVLNPGPAFDQPMVGRGLAVGDVNNDGSQDLLVVDFTGHVRLLHNRRRSGNHWLGIKLIGTRSNRDGYGARVIVKWPGGQCIRDCTAAGSYCSSMDPRLHFGLGNAGKVNEITVRWPSGRKTVLPGAPVDRYVVVREG